MLTLPETLTFSPCGLAPWVLPLLRTILNHTNGQMTINRNLTHNKQLVSYCHVTRSMPNRQHQDSKAEPTIKLWRRIDSFTDLTLPGREDTADVIIAETELNFDFVSQRPASTCDQVIGAKESDTPCSSNSWTRIDRTLTCHVRDKKM